MIQDEVHTNNGMKWRLLCIVPKSVERINDHTYSYTLT